MYGTLNVSVRLALFTPATLVYCFAHLVKSKGRILTQLYTYAFYLFSVGLRTRVLIKSTRVGFLGKAKESHWVFLIIKILNTFGGKTTLCLEGRIFIRAAKRMQSRWSCAFPRSCFIAVPSDCESEGTESPPVCGHLCTITFLA